jgi:hypothetical protein
LRWRNPLTKKGTIQGLLGVHSRYGLHTRAVTVHRDPLSEGFSHFVTSMTAPVASGWSGCRVGLAPTGKRRLCTAHARFGLLQRSKMNAYSISSSARASSANATADYSDEEMHAALEVNLPNYAGAIVTRNEIVDSLSSVQTLEISAQ